MNGPRSSVAAAASRWLAGLRYPTLFKVVLALFLIDLVLPDGLPFFDEVLLGLLAALLGQWRRPAPRGAPAGARAEKDVTPPASSRSRAGEAEGRYSARSSSR